MREKRKTKHEINLILDKFSNEVLIDSNEISVITLGGMGENGARDS